MSANTNPLTKSTNPLTKHYFAKFQTEIFDSAAGLEDWYVEVMQCGGLKGIPQDKARTMVAIKACALSIQESLNALTAAYADGFEVQTDKLHTAKSIVNGILKEINYWGWDGIPVDLI